MQSVGNAYLCQSGDYSSFHIREKSIFTGNMEDERKTKIANVLIKEHSKLPLSIKEKKLLQWGGEEHTIKLGINLKGEILSSFGFSDLDGFDYVYDPMDGSHKALKNIFEEDL